MKLPTARRILRENMPGAPSWVDGLISPLNGFMDLVYIALNNSLVLGENVAAQVVEQAVQTDGAGDIIPFTFTSTLKVRPRGLIIMQAYERITFNSIGTGNPAWSVNGATVSVSAIGGLAPDSSYTIRLCLLQ